jgi:hypothetical protein
MSGELKSPALLGEVPTVFVKGGTTTSSYDKEIKRREVDAERRRAVQDAMYATRARGQRLGEMVRLGSLAFVNQTTPRLVLSYLNADKTVRQQAISEVTLVPKEDEPNKWVTTFTMVCPRCVARGVPQGEAQMFIRDEHRKFWIDERRKGVVTVEYAWGVRQTVFVAGVVTVQDIVRCSNYNCDYACRIDQSNVIEV